MSSAPVWHARAGTALPRPALPFPGAASLLNRWSRRLLETTNTDESVMAAEARTGLSRPNAASGIAATL